jgi:hypothetical protein
VTNEKKMRSVGKDASKGGSSHAGKGHRSSDAWTLAGEVLIQGPREIHWLALKLMAQV